MSSYLIHLRVQSTKAPYNTVDIVYTDTETHIVSYPGHPMVFNVALKNMGWPGYEAKLTRTN